MELRSASNILNIAKATINLRQVVTALSLTLDDLSVGGESAYQYIAVPQPGITDYYGELTRSAQSAVAQATTAERSLEHLRALATPQRYNMNAGRNILHLLWQETYGYFLQTLTFIWNQSIIEGDAYPLPLIRLIKTLYEKQREELVGAGMTQITEELPDLEPATLSVYRNDTYANLIWCIPTKVLVPDGVETATHQTSW